MGEYVSLWVLFILLIAIEFALPFLYLYDYVTYYDGVIAILSLIWQSCNISLCMITPYKVIQHLEKSNKATSPDIDNDKQHNQICCSKQQCITWSSSNSNDTKINTVSTLKRKRQILSLTEILSQYDLFHAFLEFSMKDTSIEVESERQFYPAVYRHHFILI